jgi:putative flippase GtrA
MSTLRRCLTGPVDSTLLQVPRALAASVLAAAVDMGLLVALVEGASWHPLPAATLSYLVGAALQYLLCAVWVFPGAPQSVATGLVAFALLSLVGLGLTGMTITVVHELARVNYALAKVLALGLAFTWNFLSRKYLIFKLAV